MLEKLRAKPEHVKKNIALAITIVIFSGIVFVWWSSFDARVYTGEAQKKALSPVAGFKELFRGMVSDVEDGIWGTSVHTNTTGTMTASVASTTEDIFDLSGVVVVE